MEQQTLSELSKQIVDKLYQLTLKMHTLEDQTGEYGYPSMSGGKYKECFEDNYDLYESTIELANELYSSEAAPEDKMISIIKEVRTLARNKVNPKAIATFLNTCLRITSISNKFLFFVDEIETLDLKETDNEEESLDVAIWMNDILNKMIG